MHWQSGAGGCLEEEEEPGASMQTLHRGHKRQKQRSHVQWLDRVRGGSNVGTSPVEPPKATSRPDDRYGSSVQRSQTAGSPVQRATGPWRQGHTASVNVQRVSCCHTHMLFLLLVSSQGEEFTAFISFSDGPRDTQVHGRRWTLFTGLRENAVSWGAWMAQPSSCFGPGHDVTVCGVEP